MLTAPCSPAWLTFRMRSPSVVSERCRAVISLRSSNGLYLESAPTPLIPSGSKPYAKSYRRSSGRPASSNDNGLADRLHILLLANRMHRPQLPQQRIDQRTQPRPRRAVRERALVLD